MAAQAPQRVAERQAERSAVENHQGLELVAPGQPPTDQQAADHAGEPDVAGAREQLGGPSPAGEGLATPPPQVRGGESRQEGEQTSQAPEEIGVAAAAAVLLAADPGGEQNPKAIIRPYEWNFTGPISKRTGIMMAGPPEAEIVRIIPKAGAWNLGRVGNYCDGCA